MGPSDFDISQGDVSLAFIYSCNTLLPADIDITADTFHRGSFLTAIPRTSRYFDEKQRKKRRVRDIDRMRDIRVPDPAAEITPESRVTGCLLNRPRRIYIN